MGPNLREFYGAKAGKEFLLPEPALTFSRMFSTGPDHLPHFAIKWTHSEKGITMEGQFTKEEGKMANKYMEKVQESKICIFLIGFFYSLKSLFNTFY